MKEDSDTFENFDAFKRRVLRHEIIHAFFAESGLLHNSKYGADEELIDWIAIQFPKMLKAFEETGTLE